MKLVRLTVAYPAYLKQFYAEHQSLARSSASTQYRALADDGFIQARFWEHSLEPLGYRFTEVVANSEPLQRAWANENGIGFDDKEWMPELAMKRVVQEEPDVLIVVANPVFTRSWINELRSACPGLKAVIAWCGAPYKDLDSFKAHDLVLSCVPELVDQFAELGHRAIHFNHAFDQWVLGRLSDQSEKSHDFTFIGQINRRSEFHLQREQFILHLVERTPLMLFSPIKPTGLGRRLKSYLRDWVIFAHDLLGEAGVSSKILDRMPALSRSTQYRNNPLLSVHPKLESRINPPLFGLKMFQALRDSSLTFNSHLGVSKRYASNLRMFEATGVGTCLVTDHKEMMDEIFEPDREVVTYSSAEECAEKALYLLENPRERETIAAAGKARTARDHNYNLRAMQLDEIIKGIV
ncbi:MAG: glycosyltransferase [bacterium]|nr:glycosyltransferase [bacterium]